MKILKKIFKVFLALILLLVLALLIVVVVDKKQLLHHKERKCYPNAYRYCFDK